MLTLRFSDHADELLRHDVAHAHSVDCLDCVQFDCFVNQEPPLEKIANVRAQEHDTKFSE